MFKNIFTASAVTITLALGVAACEVDDESTTATQVVDSPRAGSGVRLGSETLTSDESEPKADRKPVRESKPEPKLTRAQENALGSATSYLNLMPFSKSGLVEQLEYEGYSRADAEFAVNNVSVNWRTQAVKSAEDYLDLMPFSRQGLIDHLIYEGFSRDNAVYAVDQTGL